MRNELEKINQRIRELEGKLMLSAQWGVDEDIPSMEKELNMLYHRRDWFEDDGA